MLSMAFITRLFHRVLADLLAGGLAELLVVGLALAERLMGDLQVGQQLAVVEEPGAEPGAEGDDQLEARPRTTAAPWMSASLAALVGTPNSGVSAAARSNRAHCSTRWWSMSVPGPATVTKCGADSTTPPRTELDSVPGGIGLTAWLGKTYAGVRQASRLSQTPEKNNGDRRGRRLSYIDWRCGRHVARV